MGGRRHRYNAIKNDEFENDSMDCSEITKTSALNSDRKENDFSPIHCGSKNIELRSRSRNTDVAGAAKFLAKGSKNELHTATSNNQNRCVERKVNALDSLQKLSLQFNVPIAEIKRMNNLIHDKDLHARGSIKIPLSNSNSFNNLLLFDEVNCDSFEEHSDDLNSVGPTFLSNAQYKVHDAELSNNKKEQTNSSAFDSFDHQNIDAGEMQSSNSVAGAKIFLKNVDDDLAKAKEYQIKKETESSAEDSDIFNAADEHQSGMFHDANYVQSTFFGSVRHYIVTVTIIFLLVLVPIGLIIYFTSVRN